MKTVSKNLKVQRRYEENYCRCEDDDDVRESLLFLQNGMEKEIGLAEHIRRKKYDSTLFLRNDGT